MTSLCSGAGGPRGLSSFPILSLSAVFRPKTSLACVTNFMVPLHSDLHRLTTSYVSACGWGQGCPSVGTTHCPATPQPCRLCGVPGGTPLAKPHPSLRDTVCPEPTVVAGSVPPCPRRAASLDSWGGGAKHGLQPTPIILTCPIMSAGLLLPRCLQRVMRTRTSPARSACHPALTT